MRKSLILFTCLLLSVAALAGKPKTGPGFIPGVGTNDGNETGGHVNTEVTLPVGLPVAGDATETSTESNSTSNIVYTFDLTDETGTASVNQTHSALEKARDMNAACVLIRINGFAGGWDVAENIRQEISGYDRPVMVYVNNQTVPAASFISSGADSIYTKKGSTISNNKFNSKSKSSSNVNAGNDSKCYTAGSVKNRANTNPDALYSNDATMNEILYKAGLGNLTVVEHQAGFSERAIDFLMNRYCMIAVLLMIGFVLRKTAKGKLPGPLLYALAVIVLLYLAPFQLSGLASGSEIGLSIVLIVALIASVRYEKKLMSAALLIALTVTFALARTGDTDVLLRFSSYSELASLLSLPMLFVTAGWLLGKIGERKNYREVSTSGIATTTLATS